MTRQMSEDELNWRMVDAARILIAAAKRYSRSGLFVATCTYPDGTQWKVIVRPGIVPAVGITAPQPVIFSLN